MPSIEYAGMKVSGGKVFAILTLLGALGSGAWATFTFYQDYLNMKDKILTYTEPDLSGFDKKIALVESETNAKMDTVSQSRSRVAKIRFKVIFKLSTNLTY